MATLTSADRSKMPAKEFAGPGHSFPLNDANHARLAISGATRSEHAGNISTSEEEGIKAKARAKLGDKGGDPPAGDHKAAIAKMHPEHLHKLVQDAHAGKFGPEAQQSAQQAMQPQQAAPNAQDPNQSGAAQPNYAGMFSGGGQADGDSDDQAVPAGQMFGGR